MTDNTPPIDVLLDRGNSFAEAGDLHAAQRCFEQACRQDPESAPALFGLGTVFYQQKKDPRAIEALITAVKFDPGVPEIWNNLGAAFGRTGKIQNAIMAFRNVCELDSNHAAAAMNLGRLLLRHGEAEEAERWLRQSDLARPKHCPTLRLIAEARLAMGQPRAALKAARDSVDVDPSDPWAHLALGKSHLSLRRLDAARDAFRFVLQHLPEHQEATYYLARTEEKAGRIDEARALFDKALELEIDPSFRSLLNLKRALALPVIASDQATINEDRLRIQKALTALPRETISDPYTAGGFTNFYLAYQGKNDRDLQKQIAHFYLDICPDLATVAPHIEKPVHQGRYKVAILSSFLRNHTVGYLSRGLIAHLDRERFHVTLLRSPIIPLTDPVAPEIAALADAVVDLPDNLPAARALVAEAEADLIYFPEIGMEDLVYFLAFARSAAVQVMGWGHPVTSGIPNIDAFLSVADMEPDNARHHYSEQLIAVEGLSLCVDKPDVSLAVADKQKFGMDPEAPAYLCAQSLFKIHPEFDSVIAALLEHDQTAHLYFLEVGAHSNEVFMNRLRQAVKNNMTRVKLIPRVRSKDFLAFLKSADLLLDVPFWAGGKTSLESLAAGTPIVHWPGAFMRGRHTLALYKHMGVMECVVDSAEAYVKTAARLVHDTAFRTSVRTKISESAPTLFNNMSAIDEISDIFEKLIMESR